MGLGSLANPSQSISSTGRGSSPGAVQFCTPETARSVSASVGTEPTGACPSVGSAAGLCLTSPMMSDWSLGDEKENIAGGFVWLVGHSNAPNWSLDTKFW